MNDVTEDDGVAALFVESAWSLACTPFMPACDPLPMLKRETMDENRTPRATALIPLHSDPLRWTMAGAHLRLHPYG
jgi:hypothetical protein